MAGNLCIESIGSFQIFQTNTEDEALGKLSNGSWNSKMQKLIISREMQKKICVAQSLTKFPFWTALLVSEECRLHAR
ncbi:hypothetical protein T02_4195 [Trichinella nativa]|uniref:Uncharacterized protein n=1 Tax=Trichinella nativa TaxID=6335 RepID=A0A0V1LP09_9BILA|nr:hypothetical protein T06_10393 [Trichinella sp. T6]KRZ61219.1 hypothetical protein T02_4195 [Trichinella nativa]